MLMFKVMLLHYHHF